MKELPKKIWLQVEEDGELFDEGEVTWCQDRINASDVEYMKLSELPTEEEINKAISDHVSARKGVSVDGLFITGIGEAAKAITKLIKGER